MSTEWLASYSYYSHNIIPSSANVEISCLMIPPVRVLAATHLYLPLSWYRTLSMVKTLLSYTKQKVIFKKMPHRTMEKWKHSTA